MTKAHQKIVGMESRREGTIHLQKVTRMLKINLAYVISFLKWLYLCFASLYLRVSVCTFPMQ